MWKIAQELLNHKDKKGSTVKWFIFALIPILNLYWLWKAAEVVSSHEKQVSDKYEKLKHMDKKESTGKWFGVFLIPVILGVIPVILGVLVGLSFVGGFLFGGLALGIAVAGILGVIAFVAGIYVLYKMAINVSGHETSYPEEYEVVSHKEKKDSTAKWLVFSLIPILNLYFLWKMGETISGHETVYE